jgi:transposase
MNDKALYEQILGIVGPWYVEDVFIDFKAGTITIKVDHKPGAGFKCPECGHDGIIHDHRIRRWRHLDTCQLQTIIETTVPRISCPVHGVHTAGVSWAEKNSHFTAIFEALVISWLKEASIAAVAERLSLSWDEVDTIRSRAVARGISRRQLQPITSMSIDETSFQKRHEYVTVLTDRTGDQVIDVLEDRGQEALTTFFKAMPDTHRISLTAITMDMWDPYICAVRNVFDNWQSIICFDRFHVAQHFGKAVDKTRATENRELLKEYGESVLAGTKFGWLRNASLIDNRTRPSFMELTRSALKTARAWAIKETAAQLWHYVSRTCAQKEWEKLLGWIRRCRLESVIKVGNTIKTYLWGVLNAIEKKVTNAKAEAINGRIQWIKKMACGFRNRKRFREAILFHLGGLDLMPDGVKFSHHES